MLSVENIEIKYGINSILKSSTLNIQKDRVTILLGRNGTGKSSIFNSIMSLIPVKDLIVSKNGLIIKKPFLEIGLLNYVSQIRCYFLDDSLDSIINDYKVESSIFYNKFKNFAEYKNYSMRNLSQGLRKLFITLVSLEADVEFTILDEPFSGVMPIYNDLIIAQIESVKDRKGILISDHQYKTLLPIADKIYLIHDKSIRLMENNYDLEKFEYLPTGTL